MSIFTINLTVPKYNWHIQDICTCLKSILRCAVGFEDSDRAKHVIIRYIKLKFSAARVGAGVTVDIWNGGPGVHGLS